VMWLGCTGCGAVEEITDAPTCACEARYRVLASAAERLEFKLTMAERHDEAAAVRANYRNLAGQHVADGDVWTP
jgi:hypothetical protein